MRTIKPICLLLIALFAVACSEEKPMTQEQDKRPQVGEEALQGIARTNLDSPAPTKDQIDRKARSIIALKKLGLPYIDHLPVIEEVSQIRPRSDQEVAQRSMALVLCAAKGELQGKDDDFIPELVKEWSADNYFSPNEAAFMAEPSPAQQAYLNHSWGYECVHVLLWALNYVDDIHAPNVICDVSDEVAIFRAHGPKSFIENARLRDQEEIFDAADFYYRLHWAAIQLRLDGESSPQIHEGIIRERHRALNWLIRYMDAEWDDVTTDT